MRYRDLYKISLVMAVIGLSMMYASSLYIQIEEVNVSEIERSWQGKNVIVQGEAVNVTESEGHLFFDLKDEESSILIVDFDSIKEVSEGEKVEVTGKVEIYRGEIEIIAEQISKD